MRKVEVKEFFGKLKQHCEEMANKEKEPCHKCRFNDFCYTAPVDQTDGLLERALENLEKVRPEKELQQDKIPYR